MTALTTILPKKQLQDMFPAPKARTEAGTVNWLDACSKRGRDGVFTEFSTLTPGLAAELLRRNPDNRTLRLTKIEQYAADMRAGRWVLNGEPFIIANDGSLNDGQHRAQAVIEANLSIPAMFVFGVPRDTRLTIDQGAARAAGDFLGMDGVANATAVASIARLLIAYERSGDADLRGANYVTNADILSRVAADEHIAAAAHYAVGVGKSARKFAAPAIIGFCSYIFSEVNPAEATAYMDQVCRGESLRAKDPAYAVRERLISMGKGGGREAKISVIIRGWNAFRQGRQLSLAKVTKGEGGNNLPALV